MTNLDYEQRMSALNQLIHETLGVSLNTVRAAYGRARNTQLPVCSTASATGKPPVSAARGGISTLISTVDLAALPDTRRKSLPKLGWSPYEFLDRMQQSDRPSFASRFANAGKISSDAPENPGTDGVGMLLVSRPEIEVDAGESASDWHKLRNEFWSIAQADRSVMDRYRHDVLG